MVAKTSVRRPWRTGQVMTEVLVGVFVLSMIAGGIFISFWVQSRAAMRMLRRTRAQLLLDGELERMRGLPPAAITACEDEEFTPSLGAKPFSSLAFYKTVRVDASGRVARVVLSAKEKKATSREGDVEVEGCLFLQGPGSNESK